MTPEERDLVTRFLDDLREVPNGQRDADAARLIEQKLSGHPEALYLLVQRTLLATQALHEAQGRIAALEAQARTAAQPSRSFLTPSASSPEAARSPEPLRQTSTQQDAGFLGGGPPAQSGGFSSFLRNAATTATGVAGGEFLFEGLSNLFGAHHAGSFLGGGDEPAVENVTINEEYNEPGKSGRDADSSPDDDVDYADEDNTIEDTDDIQSG